MPVPCVMTRDWIVSAEASQLCRAASRTHPPLRCRLSGAVLGYWTGEQISSKISEYKRRSLISLLLDVASRRRRCQKLGDGVVEAEDKRGQPVQLLLHRRVLRLAAAADRFRLVRQSICLLPGVMMGAADRRCD